MEACICRRGGGGGGGTDYHAWLRGAGAIITSSCMTIVRRTMDACIPTTSGRSTLGCHQPGAKCLYQARSAVKCPAIRTKGELHSTMSAQNKRTTENRALPVCFLCVRQTITSYGDTSVSAIKKRHEFLQEIHRSHGGFLNVLFFVPYR